MPSDHTSGALSVWSFVCMSAGQTDRRAATMHASMPPANMSTGRHAANTQSGRDTGNRAATQTYNHTVVA